MARAPFQVLVYPYRKRNENHREYALLRRADDGTWQGVAGGGEVGEKPIDWGEDVYVIPQYSFGVAADGVQITISHEHTEYGGFTYEEACSLIKYDGSRTALWELDRRLKGKGPRG